MHNGEKLLYDSSSGSRTSYWSNQSVDDPELDHHKQTTEEYHKMLLKDSKANAEQESGEVDLSAEMWLRMRWKPGDVVMIKSGQKWFPSIVRQIIPSKNEKIEDLLVIRGRKIRRGDIHSVRIAPESAVEKYWAKKKKRQLDKLLGRPSPRSTRSAATPKLDPLQEGSNESIRTETTLPTQSDSYSDATREIPRARSAPAEIEEPAGGMPPRIPRILGGRMSMPARPGTSGSGGSFSSPKRPGTAGTLSSEVTRATRLPDDEGGQYGDLTPGQWVLYFSDTSGEWLHAKVVKINADFSVDLDLCEDVPRSHIYSYPPKSTLAAKIENEISSLEEITIRMIRENEATKTVIAKRDKTYRETVDKLKKRIERSRRHRGVDVKSPYKEAEQKKKLQLEKERHRETELQLAVVNGQIAELQLELEKARKHEMKSGRRESKRRGRSRGREHGAPSSRNTYGRHWMWLLAGAATTTIGMLALSAITSKGGSSNETGERKRSLSRSTADQGDPLYVVILPGGFPLQLLKLARPGLKSFFD